MTYPITPNPAIHTQPQNVGQQQNLFTAGQLQTWAQELPLAMTLDLINAILKALGATPTEIATVDADYTSVYDAVESWLTTTQQNAANAWAELENFFQTWNFNDLTAAFDDLFGQTNSLANSSSNFWLQIQQLISGIVGNAEASMGDLVTALEGPINQWAATLDNLLGTGSSIEDFVAWLEGSSSGAYITGVSQSAITADNAQFLDNPNFSGAISLAGNGIWSYDSNVYYTQVGVTNPGSARVTANGVKQAITSNPAGSAANPIPLGQPIDYQVQVLSSGLTGSGNLVQMLAIPWIGQTAQTPIVVTQGGAPTGSTTAWTDPPVGSHAGTLSGSYTPATGSGITSVQMQLVVTSAATAGTVWFSAASEELTGGLIANLQSDFAANNAAFATMWQSIESAITTYGGSNWTSMIAAINIAYQTYVTTVTTLTTSEFNTIQQLVNSLFGINSSTGLLPQTQVSGLSAIWSNIFGTTAPTGSTQLLQTAIQDLSNAWTALFGSSATPTTGSQVLQTAVQDLDNAWTALFGSGSAPSSSATVQSTALPTAVQSANTYWSTLMSNLFGGSTPASTITTSAVPSGVPATKIANVLGNSSLGADVQAILDYIANALGHSGTGHTLANIETYLGLIPPANVTNVLGGANLGADVSSVHSTATTNTTNLTNTWSWLFGTTTPNSSSTIEQDVVNGLTSVWNLLTGTTTPLMSSAQVLPGSVAAPQSGTSLTAQFQNMLDSWWSALTGGTATGNDLPTVAAAVQTTAQQASSATAVQAQQATAKPGYMAIDASMDAVFPLSHMIAAPTYITVTQASSSIGLICTPDNVSKLSVAFLASYTGTITGAYINVYSMNTTTGALTKVIAGANISSSIGTVLGWVYYDLPSAVVVAPGDFYAVELAVTGSGSVSLMGLTNSTFPPNGSVYPKALGASRPITPTHDASGAGTYTSTSNTGFSWSHTLAPTANAILITFVTTGSVSSVKVGATSATLLGSKTWSGATSYIYELLNPPTGTQTVSVTLSSATTLGGNSDSYSGVVSFGTVASNSGTTSGAGTASVSVTSAGGQLATATLFAGLTPTGFTQTTRWSGVGGPAYMVSGDAPGASTVSFSASLASTASWAAIGVSLVGSTASPPATIASPTYSTNVPWFGLGTTVIGAITPVYAPVTTAYNSSGTFTLTVPSWVNYIDRIALGGGGGGGGGVNGAGSAGGNTTITVGTHTLTANGGAGGFGGDSSIPQCYGQSPGNETYNGSTYYGGAEVSYGQYGAAPGGGGGSGYYSGLVGYGGSAGSWAADTQSATGVTTVSITVGAGGAENTFGGSPSYGAGPGAPGAVWIVFRQS